MDERGSAEEEDSESKQSRLLDDPRTRRGDAPHDDTHKQHSDHKQQSPA